MSWPSGCWTSRWNAPAGRATRPDRASSTGSGPRSRWRRARCTMLRSRPRPDCYLWRSRISSSLQLVAVAIVVHIERGALETAAESGKRAKRSGSPRIAPHVGEFLTPAGGCGSPRVSSSGSPTCCGVAIGSRRAVCGGPASGGRRGPGACRARREALAAKLAGEQLALARQFGAPGALGRSLRSAALAIGGDDRLALLGRRSRSSSTVRRGWLWLTCWPTWGWN